MSKKAPNRGQITNTRRRSHLHFGAGHSSINEAKTDAAVRIQANDAWNQKPIALKRKNCVESTKKWHYGLE